MKLSRFAIGLLMGALAFCLSAQSVDKVGAHECQTMPLWVVDGVALDDSVFDYTLEQMQSDSAAVLASRVLSWVWPNNIVSISAMDSLEASKQGIANSNGVVNITTSFREPLTFIINGLINETKEKVSAGEILGGYNHIQHIVRNEFGDLEDYGIKEFVVLREFSIGCHRQLHPWVAVTTELPYYRVENFIGSYVGKQGRQSYELKLGADSTYIFSKREFHKKAVASEIRDHGTWRISNGEIILNSTPDPAILVQGRNLPPETLCLKIKSARCLTLPKRIWSNRKSISLTR